MAPAVCPNGHPSDSTDYCDTCGSPMGTADAKTPGPVPVETPAATKPMGVVCPNCGVMNAPGALFCEACGYDYTTGTMPRPPDPSILDLDTPLPGPETQGVSGQSPQGADSAAQTSTGPAQARPSQSPAPAPAATPTPPMTTSAASSLDLDAPTPPAPAQTASPSPAQPRPADATPRSSAPAAEPVSDTFDWVAELWVDPEWYALQDSPDPMPSAGLPEIVPLRKSSLLIGRPSRTRNIHPDIDCEPDTGISRRQAQLTTDGTRWFIEDLDSANGTFVAEASGALPTTPIRPGRRRELTGDERIYLGAWTRLVLRRATPEEQEAYASA